MALQPTVPITARATALSDADERYEERAGAGRQLAKLLMPYRGGHTVVLALPPGGVIVAGEVARALRLHLDVLVVRELFVRPYPAVAIGALSEGSGLCFNRAALRLPGVSIASVWREARRVQHDVVTLIAMYRHGRQLPLLHRRPVILVDDGLGSGLMQLAALQALRRAHAQRCIVATPGGALGALERLERRADELVTLSAAEHRENARGLPWPPAPGDDEAAALLEQCRLSRPTEESYPHARF